MKKNLMYDLIRCHRQIADLLEENISDKRRIEGYQNQLYVKEATIKELQEKVSVSKRKCPYGAKCDPKLWGDEMCQKCDMKGL